MKARLIAICLQFPDSRFCTFDNTSTHDLLEFIKDQALADYANNNTSYAYYTAVMNFCRIIDDLTKETPAAPTS